MLLLIVELNIKTVEDPIKRSSDLISAGFLLLLEDGCVSDSTTWKLNCLRLNL